MSGRIEKGSQRCFHAPRGIVIAEVKKCKNHAKRTALALFLLFAVTVSAQAAKIAEVIPIGHTVGIKMQAEGVLIVQLTEVQGADGTLPCEGGGRAGGRCAVPRR